MRVRELRRAYYTQWATTLIWLGACAITGYRWGFAWSLIAGVGFVSSAVELRRLRRLWKSPLLYLLAIEEECERAQQEAVPELTALGVCDPCAQRGSVEGCDCGFFVRSE
jgi:hypothetical protein